VCVCVCVCVCEEGTATRGVCLYYSFTTYSITITYYKLLLQLVTPRLFNDYIHIILYHTLFGI